MDSSNRGTGHQAETGRVGVFGLGERVQKCAQQLSLLTHITYTLLRHDHAWIVGQRLLLETLAFYVMVLVVSVNRNTRKRVTYRRLRAATRNSCIIYRPFDF